MNIETIPIVPGRVRFRSESSMNWLLPFVTVFSTQAERVRHGGQNGIFYAGGVSQLIDGKMEPISTEEIAESITLRLMHSLINGPDAKSEPRPSLYAPYLSPDSRTWLNKQGMNAIWTYPSRGVAYDTGWVRAGGYNWPGITAYSLAVAVSALNAVLEVWNMLALICEPELTFHRKLDAVLHERLAHRDLSWSVAQAHQHPLIVIDTKYPHSRLEFSYDFVARKCSTVVGERGMIKSVVTAENIKSFFRDPHVHALFGVEEAA